MSFSFYLNVCLYACKLQKYDPLYYVKAAEDFAIAESPNILVFGHSYEARDWVPRLSARLDIPFISDCIGFKNDNGFIRLDNVEIFEKNKGKFRIFDAQGDDDLIENYSFNVNGYNFLQPRFYFSRKHLYSS